jgi:hypothetical protein
MLESKKIHIFVFNINKYFKLTLSLTILTIKELDTICPFSLS